MTKLVFGIIAIGVLQLVFVAYTSLDEPLTVAMLPEQPPVPTQILPSLDPELPPTHDPATTEDERAANDPARSAKQFLSSTRPENTAAPSGTAPIVRQPARSGFQPAQAARPADFDTVVISYTGRQTETPACDTPATAKPKSRSLMAKAAPVVKKPWDLIKAIGSKLN
jgi:hypothetical protein